MDILSKNFKNSEIIFSNDSASSLYLNATKVAKSFNKDVREWKRSKQTIDYINALGDVGFSKTNLIKVISGNFSDKREQGTWIHKVLEDNFLQWCQKGSKSKNKQSVYLITDGEFVKIGISSNLEERLKSLQIGNARKLKVLFNFELENAVEMEQELQKEFSTKKLIGELFDLTPKDIKRIKGILSVKKRIEELDGKRS
jgi:hypothetical protein